MTATDQLAAAGFLQIGEPMDALKTAVQQDPQLREVILDHPGLEAVWW